MLYIKSICCSLLLATVLASPGLIGQDFPYSLEWKREAGLLSTGVAGHLLGKHLERRVEPFTPAELRKQYRHRLWSLDRRATYHESPRAFATSNQLLRASVLLPTVVMSSRRGRRRGLVVAAMLAETMLLNDGLTRLTKAGIRRARPLTFNEEYDPGAKLKNDARLSFVSGHTSNTAALSFFTAKVLHDLYPGSRLRPFIWAGAALVPLATGYSRYRAGKHFPTDIAAGYALGATLGILIPQWHKRSGDSGWSVGMAGEGVGLTYRW